MEKYPFTATGAAHLQLALYALSDEQLHKEADALETDFSNWINNHFILREEQLDFVNDSDPALINYIASQCSFTLRNRLPILLNQAPTIAARASKIIRPENKVKTEWLSGGAYNASGELIIHITYG